jgi:hypothetical protein
MPAGEIVLECDHRAEDAMHIAREWLRHDPDARTVVLAPTWMLVIAGLMNVLAIAFCAGSDTDSFATLASFGILTLFLLIMAALLPGAIRNKSLQAHRKKIDSGDYEGQLGRHVYRLTDKSLSVCNNAVMVELQLRHVRAITFIPPDLHKVVIHGEQGVVIVPMCFPDLEAQEAFVEEVYGRAVAAGAEVDLINMPKRFAERSLNCTR